MGGGGKGGGKGGGGSTVNVQPSPYEQQMATIAKNYYDQTQQARNYLLQDFSSFLRPAGFANQGVFGTKATTQNPPTGTTPLSSNFNVPSMDDISRNVSLAYGTIGGAPYANAQQGKDYLANLGYASEGLGGTIPAPGSSDWDSWVANKANEIRITALQNAMQNQTTNQSVPVQSSTPASSPGMTSANLYNPYNLPAYAPLYQLARTGLESQYGQARQNILSSSPRGGALAENLTNLEMGRAQQAGALPATIAAPLIQDIYNKAYGTAFGAPQTSIAGLSAAQSGYNSAQGINAVGAMQQASLNQQAGMAGAAGLGSLVGLGVKAAMK